MKGNKISMIRKVIALVLAAAILAGAVIGGVYWRKNSGGTVNVYAMDNLGSTGWGEESSTSYGNVTTDKMQNVFLSDTQIVTKVCVTEGQEVKTGDTILEYDTTLTDLDLTKKELEIQKMKIEKEDMEKQVRTRKRSEGGTPSIDRPSAPPEENAGKPGIFAMSSLPLGSRIPTESDVTPVVPAEPEEPEEPTKDKKVKTYRVIDGKGTKKSPLFVILAADYSINTEMLEELLLKKGQNWLIFLTTEGDRTDGAVLSRSGLICKKEDNGSYSFSFFDASAYPLPDMDDDSLDEPGTPEWEGGDDGWGGGGSYEDTRLTAEEIAELKEKIRDTDLDIRMAEVELKKMKKEKDNGKVVSTVDGKVSSVLDLDTAKQEGSPVVKIAGGGGYFIRCSVSELELDKIAIGQTVTVNAMESGGTYTGKITEIGDTPTTSYDYYGGNTNVSYYPFVVSVDVDADMQEYEYVSVVRSDDAVQENTGDDFYLENMFILSEGNKRFVYVRGEDGRLEKRQISVGNMQWNSTKILGGLTMDDWIAFPYGKSVKDGARTVEGSLSDLWNY